MMSPGGGSGGGERRGVKLEDGEERCRRRWRRRRVMLELMLVIVPSAGIGCDGGDDGASSLRDRGGRVLNPKPGELHHTPGFH